MLAGYAVQVENSRGRRFPEAQHPYRNDFQRDRDRVIHARAFETVPAVPLGQFQIRTAYRKNLTGLIEATGAFPWNIRRVG